MIFIFPFGGQRESEMRLKVINLLRNIFVTSLLSNLPWLNLTSSFHFHLNSELMTGFLTSLISFPWNFSPFLRLSYKWLKMFPSHLINFLCESNTLCCSSRGKNVDDDKKFNLLECRPYNDSFTTIKVVVANLRFLLHLSFAKRFCFDKKKAQEAIRRQHTEIVA